MIDEEVEKLIEQLRSKYEKNGQDFKAYLEGLLYQEYTNYWDYIQVDNLLSLQKPKTGIKDEMIFILYHQITELYFKLSLHELEQLAEQKGNLTPQFFSARVNRINSYFRNLTHSFEVMVEGMEKEQFLKFRMSLLPASGFQSAQYRMIEICATSLNRLVVKEKREEMEGKPLDEAFEWVYWKSGATELSSGKKTLTLTQFENRYADELKRLAVQYEHCNLWALYHSLAEDDKNNQALKKALRQLDLYVNVEWPLMHYKSAVRYLQKDPQDIAATGGTNWQNYLPPRIQLRIFFPSLWSTHELENWGRTKLEP